MLKKTITYTNPFTDEEVNEEHYFHISKADLVEMEMESLKEPEVTNPITGEKLSGYRAKLQRIINSEDGTAVVEVVKQMIRRSYGKKEGDRFIKSAEVWADFSSTEAYSQMLFELCTDAEVQAAFMNGIMPKELAQEAAAIAAQAAQSPTTVGDEQRGHPSDTAAQAPPVAETSPPETSDRATIAAERELPTEPRILTRNELIEMDQDDLSSGLAEGRYKLS